MSLLRIFAVMLVACCLLSVGCNKDEGQPAGETTGTEKGAPEATDEDNAEGAPAEQPEDAAEGDAAEGDAAEGDDAAEGGDDAAPAAEKKDGE